MRESLLDYSVGRKVPLRRVLRVKIIMGTYRIGVIDLCNMLLILLSYSIALYALYFIIEDFKCSTYKLNNRPF